MSKTNVQAKAQDKKQAKAPEAATDTPQAPRYLVGPWPVKAQSGNSIRAYCHSVATKLQKSKPEGFTTEELARALAENSKDTTFKQPSGGFGTKDKPNGLAMSHANWFAHPKQGWLTDVEQVKKTDSKKTAEPAKTE